MQPRMQRTTEYFRQCVGIDVAKDSFVACLSMLDMMGADSTPSFEFYNDKHGFNQFVRWARKEAVKEQPLCFVMEPTGVYYEALAIHLTKLGFTVHVVPAQRARDFARYEGYKTKTDKIDAYVLSMLGCEKRNLKPWKAPDPELATIRSLCRLRSAVIKQRTMLKNQLEALSNSAVGNQRSIALCKATLNDIQKNVDRIEADITKYVDKTEQFKTALENAMTVPGIGKISAAAILAETGCFANFSSHRQLVSFTGLDVVARQSGPCDPKRHISKKGNSAIRGMLYVCAMAAICHNTEIREFYKRIKTSNPAGKVAIVAVIRKLLVLMYTVVKNGTKYDSEYGIKD